MLQFNQDDISAALIVTLTELITLPAPNFLFVFTHVTTKDVVAFVKVEADDESSYTARYNQFTINPSVLFAAMSVGEWHYEVHEQVSDTNLDPALSGGVVEYGKLILNRATDFDFKKYDSSTSYKVYNG